MGMKGRHAVPVIVSILILGVIGLSAQSYAVTINDNVIVGASETLTHDEDTINGNVEVDGGNIAFTDVIVNGNIIAKDCVGESTIEGGTVNGNIILEGCDNITVSGGTITGNIEVKGGDKIILKTNTVHGNITGETSGVCNIFNNNVNGNIEIGDCSTEPPGEKVDICHNESPSEKKTINVSINAITAHLDHGDFVGTCEDGPDCNHPTNFFREECQFHVPT